MSVSQWLPALLLALTAVAAGWLNTVVGGGSLLTVPALMWYGLPADVANGTSRVAILSQGVTAVRGFWRQKQLDTGLSAQVALPSVAGALAGAIVATLIPNQVLTPLIVITLIVMAGSMFLSPARFAPDPQARSIHPRERPSTLLWLALAASMAVFCSPAWASCCWRCSPACCTSTWCAATRSRPRSSSCTASWWWRCSRCARAWS